ncbi:MAG: hypothetical protein JWL74_1653 [Alphaproteobacteria bacterium]|jgi:hypothetical protein|nr:hypothetical protein [Alphaproteobacteria bacterium]
MKWLLSLVAALLLAGCVTSPPRGDGLDAVARDYVGLSLEIGTHEQGYIDAYYGPPEWKQAAEANPRALPALAAAAEELQARLRSTPAPSDPLVQRRRAFLDAQLTAARTRLRMIAGERLSFAEETQGLFGVTPDIRPLSHYDPVLARIERLIPGTGPLPERVEAFQSRFVIPPGRLEAVMLAAVGECRRRTLQHIPLPPNESFTMELVSGRAWSAYNWYQGNYRSLIQVNTELPVGLSRAIDYGCHEGYPGHHAYNALLEQHLARGRGWVEYMVYPLFSPQSFIAEGSANYGIDLAFTPDERLAFERTILYPLAGLQPGDASRYHELQLALEDLAGARFTIARDYLERRIDRARAVGLSQRYELLGARRADQSIAFIDQYRGYVINYGLGKEMVRAHIESAGPDRNERWAAMRRMLSQPTLPSDLR